MPTAFEARLTRLSSPVLAAGVLVAGWWVAVRLTGTTTFPTPGAVVRAIAEVAASGVLLGYAFDSLLRVLGGYLLAAVVGTGVGIAMSLSEPFGQAANPVIQLLRPISPLAWIPVAILVFGISFGSALFLIFMGAVFPIAVATCNAVSSAPAIYGRAGKNFGLPRWQIVWRILLPAALPEMLTGLRVALGIAWLVVVAAEMIAVDSGLGYLVIDARNAGKRYDLVVAAMVLIGVIGLLLDLAIRQLEKLRALRWGFERQ